MIWTIPNFLSIMRLIAALGVAFSYALLPHPVSDWTAVGLFVLAAATDWVDGVLARALNQQTRFGAMIDPIADKAMVAIALLALSGAYNLDPLVLIPASLILLREVFVSGLREFLGDTAGTLKVTRLAKWKTTFQMVAIALLLAAKVFEHYFGIVAFGLGPVMTDDILSGRVPDELGLGARYSAMIASYWVGVGLLQLAAILTLLTGGDYLVKAMPHLRDAS
ncbi:MAG: CDP-diacylglycerol--glycerol-3-phosphate 3-phosphatidyltransferase [Pseudomonadota bacterium]